MSVDTIPAPKIAPAGPGPEPPVAPGEEPGPAAAGGVRAHLRRATAAQHAALEAQLDLLDDSLDLARYLRLLRMLYGFHAPLEERLRRAAAALPPLGVELPCRAPRLADDLAELGTRPAALGRLPRCAELPRLERIEHLAGCLYVAEGSALGSRLIAREVERRLGLTAERGASFFAADAASGAASWRRLVAALDRLAGAGASLDEMASAARATFGSLAAWARRRPAGDVR